MAGCPYRNFEPCPQHNKHGGCEFWLTYNNNAQQGDAQLEGCAVVLTPILLVQNAHALGVVAGEVNKVGHEVSAGRAENVKTAGTLAAALLPIVKSIPAPAPAYHGDPRFSHPQNLNEIVLHSSRQAEAINAVHALTGSKEHPNV